MFLHPFNRWGNTSGDQDPHLGHLTPKPPAEPPGSAASQGNVTLWKVTGTQAKSENKKNLQAMAILKLLGRRFWVILKSHSVATCLRSQSGNSLVYDQLYHLEARVSGPEVWGELRTLNSFLLGGEVTKCHACTINCVPTILLVIMTTSLKECMSIPVSDGKLEVQRDEVM